MTRKKPEVINREISWLSFNERVLQEAADPNVPLMERIKFLGIFSNNLDEFFRVRFASVRRIVEFSGGGKQISGGKAREILEQIQKITLKQRAKFQKIFVSIKTDLASENIHLVNENELSVEQGVFVKQHFYEEIRPLLAPIIIDSVKEFPSLNDLRIYLAIKLTRYDTEKVRYALIEVPTRLHTRFLVLPEEDGKKYIMLLDDVIRYNLREIFYLFKYDDHEAYTIKVTKDAELDIDDDVSTSFVESMSKSLKKRKSANAVRFIYDKEMPEDLLQFFRKKLKLAENDSIVAGARYHNFKDFMGFPDLGMKHLKNKRKKQLAHPLLKPYTSLFTSIAKHDILLHYPYHSFHHFTDLLREAAIDPKVKSIKITVYRVAEHSGVISALTNAVKNGKKVTVVVELQARFDEERNIYYGKVLQEKGVKVIYGVKGLKTHSKLCLITRKEKGSVVRYANIGTGNFNESTSKLYTDQALLTADPRLTNEIDKVFAFFENNLKISRYTHLMLSPFSLRSKLVRLINTEIKNAKAGKEAYITLKLNSLVDKRMIAKLYEASQAGVKIKMIIRGICSLIPGVKGLSDNIEAISIIDKYLEHSRIYVFCNDGNPKYYISSADLMTRNLDHRMEVACPIYDPSLQAEIDDILAIQFADNVKARLLTENQQNQYRKANGDKPVRAQEEIHNYLKKKSLQGLKDNLPLVQEIH